MKLRRIGYATVIVVLLCVLTTGSSEGKRPLSNGDGWVSPEKNKDMAWIHCRKELIGRKETCEDLYRYLLKDRNGDSFPRIKIYEVIGILPPQMKQKFSDCLRKKHIPFGVSHKKTIFSHCFIKCIELLFDSASSQRRYLADESYRQKAPASSPTQASVFSLTSIDDGRIVASSPSPSPTEQSISPEADYSVADIKYSPPPPVHQRSPVIPHVVSYRSQNNHEDIEAETIVAVVITAAATFLIVALICCCVRGKSSKVDPRYGQSDRPLLNLSLSDISGSSQKSLSVGSSSQEPSSNSNAANYNFSTNMSMKLDNKNLSPSAAQSSDPAALPPLKPPPGRSAPPPPGPPPPPPPAPIPAPPKARPPPAPPKRNPAKGKPSPLGPRHQGSSSDQGEDDSESGSHKAKLKPFFWDKVLANPDQSMVWHEIRAGSFQFNEELIETLFGYNSDKSKNDNKKESSSQDPSFQYIKIIDTRKAQNLSILLRALGVTTEEVVDALQEGNELPIELLQTLLKMAPTSEEELKLRLFAGDVSQLGPAEQFLKVLVEIPFAFKRLAALLFMCSFPEEVSTVKESFVTLEVACNKLRSSRLFLKLLEAVLKTGNRMNDGTYRGDAQAFKLDTLLKLSDVKGLDGKTTLLHFVVQEIIRSEGIRAIREAKASASFSSAKTDDFVDDLTDESTEHYRSLGLQMVSGLSSELEDVKKAAVIDSDVTTATLSKLRKSLIETREFLDAEMKSVDEETEFYHSVDSFLDRADCDISWLAEEEKRITTLVKSTADYFHGNAGKDEGLRLFVIVRDLLIMLDKICKEIKDDATTKPIRAFRKEVPSASASPDNRQSPSDFRRRIADQRMDYSSSDEESTSP